MLDPEFLTRSQLVTLVGLSSSTIYRLESQGQFPARVRLSSNRVAWKFREVIQWMKSRPRCQKVAGMLTEAEGTAT